MRKILRILWRILKWFLILSIASVVLFRFVPIPITPLMVIRCFEQAFAPDQKIKLHKDWTRLENISSAMPLAVIAAEDQKFEEHFGFDVEAIEKAQKFNQRNKTRKRGASTITQQTAKNVFLFPTRSWIRKGFEAYFTLLIEIFWSKKRIMEVYLNVIETGDGIYGVEAAAQTYFNKPAKKLTLRESALIAAVLPNPRKWSPASPSAYIQRKSGRIIQIAGKLNPKDF